MKYLRWFHHVPRNAKLSSGLTLWVELAFRYNQGVKTVDQMAETWQSREGKVAPDIHASVMKKLLEQKDLARQWPEARIRYFSAKANLAAP